MSMYAEPFTAAAAASTSAFKVEIHSALPGSPVVPHIIRSPRAQHARRLVAQLLQTAARRVAPAEPRQVACAPAGS